jgi:hypothetical protein
VYCTKSRLHTAPLLLGVIEEGQADLTEMGFLLVMKSRTWPPCWTTSSIAAWWRSVPAPMIAAAFISP